MSENTEKPVEKIEMDEQEGKLNAENLTLANAKVLLDMKKLTMQQAVIIALISSVQTIVIVLLSNIPW